MLTGIPPFYHTNQKLMFQLIVESEVKFPSQVLISEDAKDLIMRVWLCCFKTVTLLFISCLSKILAKELVR